MEGSSAHGCVRNAVVVLKPTAAASQGTQMINERVHATLPPSQSNVLVHVVASCPPTADTVDAMESLTRCLKVPAPHATGRPTRCPALLRATQPARECQRHHFTLSAYLSSLPLMQPILQAWLCAGRMLCICTREERGHTTTGECRANCWRVVRSGPWRAAARAHHARRATQPGLAASAPGACSERVLETMCRACPLIACWPAESGWAWWPVRAPCAHAC